MTETPTRPAPAAYGAFDAMPISGRWRPGRSDRTLTDTDPWSGEILLELRTADRGDLEDAVAAAQDAQADWAGRTARERAEVMLTAAELLEARRDEVTAWLIRESGSTVPKADFELDLVLSTLRLAASLAHDAMGRTAPSDIPGKENYVYAKPVGVVAVISPWNFPLYIASRSVAPALGVGNAVVLKPSSDTPVTGALLLAKLLEEAGLPPGVLDVVVGSGSEIGDALVEHPGPRVLSFTGSTPVGETITHRAGLKKLSLELGGNGPLVVLDDADLEIAVRASVFGSFFHQGQICMIANRIIVDAAVHDQFVRRFVERVGDLGVGDPSDPATAVGPVINRRQLEGILDKLRRARDGGAEQLLGGDPMGPTGQVLPPHVLLGTNDVATAREEVFGPVITIVRADGDEEALALANDTEYGLSSAVITTDVDRGLRFARRIEAGMTHVNDAPVNDEPPHAPFGGEKRSGIGRFGGPWVLEEFTTYHWISIQREPREYPI